MRKAVVPAWGLAFVVAVTASGAAQVPSEPPARQAEPRPQEPLPPAPEGQESEPSYDGRSGADIFRYGTDYTVEAGRDTGDVVIVGGSVTVQGHTRDLVVLFGTARLASTAVVDGDMVVIGGNASVESGAVANGDLVVVGGALESPADFVARGEQVILGSAPIGEWLRRVLPWLTRGLLWGRLIVPDLAWVWAVAGLVLLLYVGINVVFSAPVGAATQVLSDKTLTAFLVGLLVLLATGPVTVLLAVTVVGIAVIPFVWCALFLAGLLGKVAAVRWLGSNLAREASPATWVASTRSVVIGFVVLCLVYMVPLLGLVTWVSLGVLGMGAAALAFVSGLRRENPRPPAMPAPPRLSPPPLAEGSGAVPVDLPAGSAGMGVGAPAGADMTLLPRATFLSRLGAFVLDVLLVALAFGLLDVDLDRGPGRLFLVLLVYHVAFWTWQGTTVGGIICQLRVIRTDGRPLRFVDALVRGLSSIFSFAVLGLGCLWILRDPERQSWHDRIAGTYVVDVPKGWPLP